MLYLVRKLDQSIIINNDIEVKIVKIKKNSVKIGINFPASATIYRKEVHEKIAQENAESLEQDFPGDVTVRSIK